jgi:ubiquinol-cytochrome c reductase cytochrome b subunit
MKKIFLLLYTRKSLTYFWNYGSILGIVLLFQLISGFFLVFYYSNDRSISFDRVQYIIYEVTCGWVIRIFHFNGASLLFIFLYLHFFKGLRFFSYRLKGVWLLGIVIFLLFIIIAFIGYVLVWAQMRFWASVVITSLLTVVPFWGFKLVFWVWGGFSVRGSTLKFFFALHFLIPWLRWVLIFIHLYFLHKTGSSSRLYCFLDLDKVNFFPYFVFKDFLNLTVFFLFFIFCMFCPFTLGDSEMFLESNILVSPIHIVPEWYFLFAYAILRCVPNKIVGVIFLLLSIFCFFFFLLFDYKFSMIDYFNLFFVFRFFVFGFLLSWLGQCVIEYPFIFIRGLISFLYFFFVFLMFFVSCFSFLQLDCFYNIVVCLIIIIIFYLYLCILIYFFFLLEVCF